MPHLYKSISGFLLMATLAVGAPALAWQTAKSNHIVKPAFADKVYICESSTSYAYHQSKTCRGLSRCTHSIKELTKDTAAKKRKACKICF